jgi:hypothetical protein
MLSEITDRSAAPACTAWPEAASCLLARVAPFAGLAGTAGKAADA